MLDNRRCAGAIIGGRLLVLAKLQKAGGPRCPVERCAGATNWPEGSCSRSGQDEENAIRALRVMPDAIDRVKKRHNRLTIKTWFLL